MSAAPTSNAEAGPSGQAATSSADQKMLEAQQTAEIVKSFSPVTEFKRLTGGRIPCARSSMLLGLGTMAGVSAVGIVSGRNLSRSLNWGVASFAVVSIANFQICRTSHAAEARRMRIVIDEHNRKRAGTSDKKMGSSIAAKEASEGVVTPKQAKPERQV